MKNLLIWRAKLKKKSIDLHQNKYVARWYLYAWISLKKWLLPLPLLLLSDRFIFLVFTAIPSFSIKCPSNNFYLLSFVVTWWFFYLIYLRSELNLIIAGMHFVHNMFFIWLKINVRRGAERLSSYFRLEFIVSISQYFIIFLKNIS